MYQFVNAIRIHEELCRVCSVERKHDKLSIKELVQILNLWNPSFEIETLAIMICSVFHATNTLTDY